jgi:hypothetical protein
MVVTSMKQKQETPPNYLEIVKHLGELDLKNVIFCYGDTIYNPTGKTITPDLEIHEDTHRKQQGHAPDIWWEQYLTDPIFRLNQELEAYGAQYQFACKAIDEIKGPASMKKWALESMAKALSGEIYGRIIGLAEAQSKIRNYAKILA